MSAAQTIRGDGGSNGCRFDADDVRLTGMGRLAVLKGRTRPAIRPGHPHGHMFPRRNFKLQDRADAHAAHVRQHSLIASGASGSVPQLTSAGEKSSNMHQT